MNAILAIPIGLRLAGLAIIGACIGSAVNWAVYRLAWNQRAIGPWSPRLPEAQTRGWLDRLPVLGWIGVALLAVLLWTGYRNILRLLERDPEAGRLRLGLFVIAVIYNLTEAGIRTTDLVWIAFLFAIIALPKPAVRVAAAPKAIETNATIEAAQFV